MKKSKRLCKAVCIESSGKYLELNKIYFVNHFTLSLLEVYNNDGYVGVFYNYKFKKISKIREEKIDSIL